MPPTVVYDTTPTPVLARFSGTCPVCGKYIAKNRSRITPIDGKWVHAKCYTQARRISVGRNVTWQEQTRWEWPQALWIDGDGCFALLAHCKVLTISLHTRMSNARKWKSMIDSTGCGGGCQRDHEIINLRRLRGSDG